jgi:hypothetical protein
MLSALRGRCFLSKHAPVIARALSGKDLAGTHQNPVVEELWEARRSLKEKHQGEVYERNSDGVFIKKPSDSQWAIKYQFSKEPVR